MATVEFIYKGEKTLILCSENDKMEDICKKFGSKMKVNDINQLLFYYSGRVIDINLTLLQIINNFDKERKTLSILVYDLNQTTIIKRPKIINSVFPICKKCNDNFRFDIEDYKIICSGCKNGHSIDMFINEYEEYLKIDISEIKCGLCSRSKYDTFNNEMFVCSTCKINLCPLCKNNHDKSHNLINYDSKNYICANHKELFMAYCQTCGMNICFNCYEIHNGHEKIIFGEISPNKNKLFEKLKDFKDNLDIFNREISQIINKFINVKENIEKIYQIYSDMINKYDDKYRNYELFKSLNNVNDNTIIEDLKRINKEENINLKIKDILNIYEKMKYYDITMIYNINKEPIIKIFGKAFVEKNKDKCIIIHDNIKSKLSEEFIVPDITKEKLEIKLRGINNITSMKNIRKIIDSYK